MIQGKTHLNNDEQFGAANAVDKDLTTQAGATKSQTSPAWLKLEFDKTYHIHTVIFYYKFFTNWFDPYSWCASSVRNFRSCVNIDNNVDVSVYQGDEKQKFCGTLQLTYGLEQSDQIYTLVCNIGGDAVKLSAENLAVYEIAVTSTSKLQSELFKNTCYRDVVLNMWL